MSIRRQTSTELIGALKIVQSAQVHSPHYAASYGIVFLRLLEITFSKKPSVAVAMTLLSKILNDSTPFFPISCSIQLHFGANLFSDNGLDLPFTPECPVTITNR